MTINKLLAWGLLTVVSANVMGENMSNSFVSDSLTLNTIVITGTRTPKTLSNTPIVTRVITADEIRKLDATDIRDVLKQEMAGVEMSYAMSQNPTININGFSSNNILFLVDGERLAGETMANVDYSRLNMDDVERIEIIRGAASSLYGSNAVGGVINIITKRSKEKWNANINAKWGKYDEHRHGATFMFNAGKLFSSTNIQHTKISDINLKSPSAFNPNLIYGNRTWNFKERLVYQLSDKIELSAHAGYFFRQRNYSTATKDRYRDYNGGLKGVYDITANDHVEVSYVFDQYDKSDLYTRTKKDVRDYSNVQHSVRALYNHSFTKDMTLTLGGDFMRDYLMTYQFKDNGSRHQESADGFAQLDFYPISGLNTIIGLRYDYFTGVGKSNLAAKVGLMYKLGDFTLRGSYSGGFRSPSLKEMYMNFNMQNIFTIYGNKDLKSEQSHNFQVSTEYRHGNYDFTVTGFHNFVENRITNAFNSALNGLQYVNTAHINIVGVTADATAHWANGFDARLSYSYTHEIFRKRQAELYSTRPHSITGRVNYGHSWKNYGFNVSLSGRFMSALNSMTFTDVTNLTKTSKEHYPSYSIFKLTLVQHFYKKVDLTLAVDNLLNYVPDYFNVNSPITNGATFSFGFAVGL